MIGEIIGGGHVKLTTRGTIQNISKIAIGQPIIGIANNSNYKICFGIFCPFYQPLYSMNFTGRLNYSNGSVVINTPVEITIKYSAYNYVGRNNTDSLGIFFIKIDDLPEGMMNKNLEITIHVTDEIEAVYNCLYNYSSPSKTCCKLPLTAPCL